jgi:uncharacterized membrane protein (UPF0127 family)
VRSQLVVNLTRERCVCVGELADGPLSRMRGLLGRSGLPAGEGLLLSPAPSIHTAFMRFPIDAVFLDRELRVLGIAEQLRPWRVASRRRARAVLELAAGECARCDIQVGDRLGLRDRRPVETLAIAGASPRGVHGQAGEAAGGSVIWSGMLQAPPEPPRSVPLRVLVISGDRHFRSVSSMLLGYRGCSVVATARARRVEEVITCERADVVVIDAGNAPAAAQAVAAMAALACSIGIVVVDEIPVKAHPPRVLAKWGPFEDLFSAIEAADKERGADGS